MQASLLSFHRLDCQVSKLACQASIACFSSSSRLGAQAFFQGNVYISFAYKRKHRGELQHNTNSPIPITQIQQHYMLELIITDLVLPHCALSQTIWNMVIEMGKNVTFKIPSLLRQKVDQKDQDQKEDSKLQKRLVVVISLIVNNECIVFVLDVTQRERAEWGSYDF
ncbi:hypothetical protein Lal_00000864 [Lupinus albus]|nr:hypothetical protein Lal_00000864 [Lupinus albus]